MLGFSPFSQIQINVFKICNFYQVNGLHRNKQLSYNLVVAELSQTCDEFNSILRSLLFLNNRNLRAAEMVNEITQSSWQLEEKSMYFFFAHFEHLARQYMYNTHFIKKFTRRYLIHQLLYFENNDLQVNKYANLQNCCSDNV